MQMMPSYGPYKNQNTFTKILNLPKLGILLNDLIQYNITSNTL